VVRIVLQCAGIKGELGPGGIWLARLAEVLKAAAGATVSRGHAQCRSLKLYAFAEGVIHYFGHVTATLFDRQKIHARKFFTERSDVELINGLPHFLAHGRRPGFPLLAGGSHTSISF
jgi:hypothetical protein